MEKFGEMLKRFIVAQNLTVSYVASLIGINRGGLYNIFSSSRVMPEDKLLKMLKSEIFTKEQCALLRRAYFSGVYGEKRMDKIAYFISALKQLDSENTGVCSVEEYIPQKGSESIAGQYNVLGCIRHILKKAAENPKSNKVFTNFSYELASVDKVVGQCAAEYAGKLQLYHAIALDREDEETDNLRKIFLSLKYVRLGYSPLIYYTDAPEKVGAGTLYPYYFVSSDFLFRFDETGNSGFVISEMRIAANTFLKVKEMFMDFETPAVFCDTQIDYKNVYSGLMSQSRFVSLSQSMCLSVIMDRDILERFAKKGLSGREMMIEMYLKDAVTVGTDSDAEVVMTVSGIHEFAENGIAQCISKEYADPMPEEYRRDVLQRYVDVLSDVARRGALKIIDESEVVLPRDYYIDIAAGKVLMFSAKMKTRGNFIGEAVVAVSDSNIVADAADVIDYIKRNGFYLSNEEAIEKIEEIMS